MEFGKMLQLAMDVKLAYAKYNTKARQNQWDAAAYTQGLMGDLGDLAKLVMAKQNLRAATDVDNKLAHELADCLWSVMVIADELKIDLEQAFVETMTELKSRM